MTTDLLGVGVSFAEELSGVVTVRGVTTATVGTGSCRAQGLTLPSGERTWTVLGAGHRVVGPAEEYLEYLRAQQVSPNTVKSYARALALWWQFLELFGLDWDAVTLENFGAFLTWLRTGDEPEVVSIERRRARFAESTIAARLGAVISCYDYHVLNGVDVGRDLHRITHRGGGRYKPLLEHVARRKGRRQAVIRVRHRRRAAPPILTPVQIERICEACASWDTDDAAVARIGAQQIAVDVVGGDGRSGGRGPGVAAPRLAHRVRRHPVHRGRGPRPSPRGAGQERLPTPAHRRGVRQ